MSRKSRMQSVREAKDRRAKRLAIGGAVVLAALLAFELPHYLGGSSSPTTAGTTSASSTPGTTTPGATTTPASTAAGTAAAVSATATTSTKLPNSDVPPPRSKSQLSSFTLFAGKDPFVQQVSTQSASTSSSSGTGPAATGSSASSPPTSSSQPTQQTSARTLTGTGVATIAVNGKSESVRVGESFPRANPVFKLVSLARGAANIGIANGAYTSGAHTVRLSSGHALTLVDTADGIRYRLRLLSAP
jgi:hypothetical protein